jgi:hypothetical protein
LSLGRVVQAGTEAMKVSRNPTVHCRAVQAAVWSKLEFEFQFGSRELVSGGRWKGVRHLENQHVCTLFYCSAFLWSFARTLPVRGSETRIVRLRD